MLLTRQKSKVEVYDFLLSGKRRYDRKNSGYGGQTKPVFKKKVQFRHNYVILKVKAPCPASVKGANPLNVLPL